MPNETTTTHDASGHVGSTDELGPLPPVPFCRVQDVQGRAVAALLGQDPEGGLFTEAQLLAAVAAERERCARIVERINGWTGTQEVAAEIRGETKILRA